MSEVHTFRCDICSTEKKESNHWWRGYILDRDKNERTAGVIIVQHDISSLTQIFSRQPINFPKVADVDLCGFECAAKWLGQQMEKIVGGK